MSLSQRLRRLLRAHVSNWAHGNDDAPSDLNVGGPTDDAATPSDADAPSPRGPDGRPVPPDVARAYRALEVPVGSDRAAVKTGYRRVMKAYHQDRFDNDPQKRDVAGEVSKRLNGAYERVLAYLDRVA